MDENSTMNDGLAPPKFDGTENTGTATDTPPPPLDQSPAQQDSQQGGVTAAPDGPDAILASAASTAHPDALPQVEGQPPEVAQQQGQVHQQPNAFVPVRSLETARALPELTWDGNGGLMPFESEDPTAILAFKDEDGRTMRVVLGEHGLAKIHVER